MLISTEQRHSYVQCPSGLIVPEHVAASAIKPRKRLTAMDLFAGAGGFSLGIIEAGFDVVAAADWSPPAAITYLMNLGAHQMQFHWVGADEEERRARAEEMETELQNLYDLDSDELARGAVHSGSARRGTSREAEWKRRGYPGVEHYFFGDICHLKGKDMLRAARLERGELDLLVGSPPCQGFSTANANAGPHDERNNLVFEWVRLVLEINPKSCCMENVPGMLSETDSHGIPIMDTILKALSQGGFSEYEAMRKAIESTHGKGALIQRGKKSGSKQTDSQQPTLFDA